MHSEPTYFTARMAAPRIEAHFARHRAAVSEQVARLAAPPDAACVEAIIDVAFWASLRREEGRPPRISLALLLPPQARQPLQLGEHRRLTPHNLLKLAPAVEQPGIHLGVWHDADGLYIWGATTALPPLCFVLEVVEAGLLVVKHTRAAGFGKYVNVAVLRGDRLQLVDEGHAGLSDCPALQSFLPGRSLPAGSGEADPVLLELAAAMRAHGRGGMVLVVPPGSSAWQASVVHPLTYPVAPAYKSLRSRQRLGVKRHRQERLRRSIGVVGGFTAIDGATVITQQYHLLAFGAKVTRAKGSTSVDKLMLTKPVVGSEPAQLHPAQYGGTRHLAAAQFVHDQHDSLALVASQDGFFTVFAWSETLQQVHAHRIDMLLL